jgi:hypothetical protein
MANTPVNTPQLPIPQDELPDWMLRAMRRTDWGVLIVLILSLLMGWSFALNPGLPRTNDVESYVFRTADTTESFLEGRLYPRWSSHALNGYGAPIPHYYPPGAPYIAAVLSILFTGDAVLAVRLVFIASFGLAGTMVYALVLRRTNAAAGIVAALLYVYSPYVGLVAPHVLGDLPGVMSLALVPTLLWAANRHLQRHQPADGIFVIVATAALLLTSPAHLGVGLLLVMLLIGLHLYERQPIRPVITLSGALSLGLCLSAFYWLPALAEQMAVRWQPTLVEVPMPILTLATLFESPRQIDPSALTTPPQFTLGIMLPLFALAAAWRLRRICFQSVFLMVGGALLIFGVFIVPHFTWLLGIVCLCWAIGGSAALDWRASLQPSNQRLILAVTIFFIFMWAIPVWMSPRNEDEFGEADAATQVRYEQQGLGVAVLPPGAPIPSTLKPTTTPNRLLLSGYAANSINRFSDDPTIQNQASVLYIGSHYQEYQIRLRETTTVRLLTAYFLGWQIYLNDQALPAYADETGLIGVTIPGIVGGDFVITLGETPPRAIAWLVTLMTLVVMAGSFWRQMYVYHPPRTLLLNLLSPAETRLLVLTLLLTAGGAFFATQLPVPYSLRAQGQYALRDSTLLRNRSDTGLEVLYFRLDDSLYHAGDYADVTLYWQTVQPLLSNYQARLTLRDVTTGREWSSTPLRHPGYIPTRRWIRGRYVTDHYDLLMPANIAPGRYSITITAYPCAPACNLNTPLQFFAPNGTSVGTSVTLPRILTVE